jgi:protein-S-isoprenylcysteine O-methyltransferase Ste14
VVPTPWWGLAGTVPSAVLLAVHCGLEERVLTAGLAGYDNYARRVRCRLVPGQR